MKRVLIISPHFPPINAPDMQRIRMSLPYYRDLGWEAVVIAVRPEFVDGYVEEELLDTYPSYIEVHRVNALPLKKTSKLGFGSLSIRSFFQMMKKGNELLRERRFDLVFFSTSTFHVCRLGPYWKKKFNVPFVIDMQDPWRNDYYLDKPKSERPPKFWLAYNLDKKLEADTIPEAAGILSVSRGYIDILLNRYPSLVESNCKVLPFCASERDHEVATGLYTQGTDILPKDGNIHFVYAGRGGKDLRKAIEIIFSAIRILKIKHKELAERFRFTFVGTSYAASGKGSKTILPVAKEFGLDHIVCEITDRLPFLKTLALLHDADILIAPGSTDTSYTASKIYPYVLSEKPLLAVFNSNSSVVDLLRNLNFGEVVEFKNEDKAEVYSEQCAAKILTLINMLTNKKVFLDKLKFADYLAPHNAFEQVRFFEQLLSTSTDHS